MNDNAPAATPPGSPANFDVAKFALAGAAGLAAAIAGAVLWAVVTVLTEYEIGIMAVAVGFMVGRAIIFVAKSGNLNYGILGAVLSLFGCLLGIFLSGVGFAAQGGHISYLTMLGHLDFDIAIQLMKDTFGVMDLLFYAIGIYEGFRFASRR